MEEKRKEDFEHEFDDEELDLTKDAFFSDLINMEEEIASEAYELVEHAVNLIESQYYDDSIEILRQAIGLYTQINREDEIKAINEKISEVYLQKEQAFREIETKPEELIESIEELPEFEEIAEIEKTNMIEEVQVETDLIDNANQLIVQAHELANNNKFEEALDIYDKAEKILENLGKSDEIERLYSLIEDCYNKKAEYLRRIKKEEPIETLQLEEIPRAEKIKEKKLEQFLEAKKREEELSSQAYEILDQAVELAKINEYDQAIKLYREGANLFEELNWIYEAKRIRDTIEQLEKEKIRYFEGLEKERQIIEQKMETEIYKEKVIDQHVKEISEQERLAQLEKVRGLKLQKMELEFFKAQVDNMATEAARMAREYELAMQKAIKEGNLLEECIYPKVIEIYKRIKELLVDKGWNNEAAIYDDTINVYIQKLEQDQNIRKIEADKKIKQKETEEMLKVKEDVDVVVDKEKLELIEEQLQKETEIQIIKSQIEERTKRAERLAREYEVALRQGKFGLKCPYPEIINIFKEAKQIALERGWETDVTVYSSQIYTYNQKLEKDNRLRQIEADKVKKQEEIEEMLKVKEDLDIVVDKEQLELIEEKRRFEKEEEEFDNVIEVMVNRAESLAKEYDLSMKKAIKEGKLAENPPFLKIISIYERVKRMLLDRGREESEAATYNYQINYYSQKLEQDNKLREVEAKKAQRERALEEMHKIGKEIGVDEKRLKAIEIKKEEEDFEKYVTDNVNIAEKMVRNYEIEKRKAYRDGKILENTPYVEVIDIYKQLREKVYARGWKKQAEIFANQIKIYQEKQEKHEKLLEIEAKKAKREKEIEEMYKDGKKKTITARPERIGEIKAEQKDQDILLDKAMNLIDEAEKTVKSYELSIRKDILVYESPYNNAISNYEQAREIFQKIGWNDEASRLVSTIKFYKDKKEKDDNLREIEKRKLEKPEIEFETVKIKPDKDFLDRQKRLKVFEQKQKESDEKAVGIMYIIQNAERMAQEYELKLKSGVFDYEAPYEKIIEMYRDARKKFEQINWKEESAKLIDTINFYKEKLAQDKKIRALEAEKAKKRDQELLMQQRLLEQARVEQERLLQQRKESLDLKKERIAQFETEKDKAFRLMDQAKRELRQNNFDKAIEIYKESEKIFIDMKWQEGLKMVRDSILMISNKKEAFEIEKKFVEERKAEELRIEEKLEEKLIEAQLIKKQQQEEKRREFLKIQRAKEQERQMSEEAYELLEHGTALMERGKFTKAYEIYIAAREIFEKISWQREVSRINNELLFKLKREQKQAEILEDIKIKKEEEDKEILLLKEEAKREREEEARRRKEEKRRFAKEEVLRKISAKLDKANKLIENLQYNEGVLMMIEEINRLTTLGKEEDVSKINEQIGEIKRLSEIPLITLEFSEDDLQNKKLQAAFRALDNAQVAMAENQFKRAISELNEAKFQLSNIKMGKKFLKEINQKIDELREKLGIEPSKDRIKISTEDEAEKLRARIAARREERRKKVLELLKKKME
ncbi:MAG: hypothetical protein JSV62_12290 [Promethearchaeota archaeon]|nr:MAG: hypothetical protein JSV62_12290 [Candidatus Lokiarchaeota archaeon]